MPQWTLFENDFRSIDKVLNELLDKSNALSTHLVDRSGQLITTAGRTGDFDTTAFASLVAADFTANAEIALLLGEAGIEAVVSQGGERSIYSCLLAERVIMIHEGRLVFDGPTKKLLEQHGSLDRAFHSLTAAAPAMA